MSDTIKIILMVSLFAFFIYRKKFSAFLAKRKDKHTSSKNTEKGTVSVPAAPDAETTKAASCGDSPGGITERCSVPFRYEAYAFDYAEYPETGHFADRIGARLDMIEMSMQNKRHYIKFVELGTCLLILVKYQD